MLRTAGISCGGSVYAAGVRMRTKFLTSVAAVAMIAGSPALAASPTPYNWSGFYVGANIGVAYAHNTSQEIGPLSWFDTIPGPVYGANATGVIGGIQAGYNWQFQHLVLGVEGDLDLASANADTAHVPAFNTAMTQTASLKGLATFRGRAGYAFDNALIYATGGFATGRITDRVIEPGASNIIFESSRWRTGWVAGGGVEYAVAKNWTIKAEALYADFGTAEASLPSSDSYRFRFKDTATIGRVGFNFRF
jgi:outer membrane immunogenic protein